MTRERGLELVDGERQESYGEPVAHMQNVARAWSGVLGYTISAKQVALLLATLKIVREANRHGPDNCDDVHGYIEIAERIEQAGWTSTTLADTNTRSIT